MRVHDARTLARRRRRDAGQIRRPRRPRDLLHRHPVPRGRDGDPRVAGPEGIELFHGYTYSGHPLACAAGIATLDTYEQEGLLERASSLEKHWEDAIHSLKDAPNVIDIRNYGLMGAIEFAPKAGAPGSRGYNALVKCFEAGVLTRYTADTLAFSPPLIVEKAQIDRIFDAVRKVLQALE